MNLKQRGGGPRQRYPQGVSVSAITVTAYGEMPPIIPTEDGVRELQNLRVEVRIGGSWR